jgi:malate dehydrogenase (oxaloacetate-decarboxylating)(NADP+)
MSFGPKYIIPKPFDHRVLIWVASAVAKAAIDSGVAQIPIDIEKYKEQLENRLGRAHELMRIMVHKARQQPKRVVFPEGEQDKILRACQILVDEQIAQPILIGDKHVISSKMETLRLSMPGVRIVNPAKFTRLPEYTEQFFGLRQRKGVTRSEAEELILNPVILASMMLRLGDADALIGGLSQNYPDTLRPALQVIPARQGLDTVCGMYMLIMPNGQSFFLADTTVNIEPSAEDLAEIAILTAETARDFNVEPRVAMLSFSNFGSVRHPLAEKVRRAVEIVRERAPDLMVDGEMQADSAVVPRIMEERYPFSALKGGANVLIFPNLESGNIAYKLLQRIGGAEAIGPILMGLSKPVHVLQRGDEVSDIVNMTAVAVVDAQEASSIRGRNFQRLA